MSLYVALAMIPGVVVAAVLFFRWPQFRGARSIGVACGSGFLIMVCLLGFTNLFRNADFQTQLFLSLSALLVAGLFWWITQKTERAKQSASASPIPPRVD